MRKRQTLRRALPVALSFIAGAAVAQTATSEQPYLAEVKLAMDRMMDGMMVTPTGDVDRDFVSMMRPHHQGAIDMSVAELRFGRNEQLKRIAQEIIVDQQQEIAAMNLAIGEPLPPSVPVPTQPGSKPILGMPGMSHLPHQEH
jgi:hypothetical protein